MELLHFSQQWLETALAGMSSPWAIGLALILTSFLLEDVSIAAAAALATHGTLSWDAAFAWVFAGIALGDIGLYAVGLGARRVPWLRRKYIEPQRHSGIKLRLESQLASAVLLARVVPGLRLVTYTLCGFARVPLLPFCLWVGLAVALWTAGLFWLGAFAGRALAQALHLPQPVAVALPIVAVALCVPLVKYMNQRRKATA
jgi:membrane protein DedA with SNARE-associated domain